MYTIDAVLKGTIDNKRANIVLKALHIAVRNSRNVYFQLRPDDMVREVPNHAAQYVRGAEQSPTEDCHPEEAQAFAKRRPVNEGSLHSPANAECHPERARTSRESKDPRAANGGNTPAGNSPNPSERTREKARDENTPPLTTHQTSHNHEIKKLEASIEGTMRGNWRDLRTVFNAVGLTPPKTPKHLR